MSSFDDILRFGANMANKAIDDANKKRERIEKYKEEYAYLDDQTLIKKFKSSSGDKKLALGHLLKERGYGPKN